MNGNEPTNQEILTAINDFATKTEERFEKIESAMTTKENLKDLATKDEIQNLATREDWREMRDKLLDSIDNKLADLKGEIVLLMRKEDHKIVALIEELSKQKLLSAEAAKRILSLDPFPRLRVS